MECDFMACYLVTQRDNFNIVYLLEQQKEKQVKANCSVMLKTKTHFCAKIFTRKS